MGDPNIDPNMLLYNAHYGNRYPQLWQSTRCECSLGSAEPTQKSWVAVKDLKLSYYDKETLLLAIFW